MDSATALCFASVKCCTASRVQKEELDKKCRTMEEEKRGANNNPRRLFYCASKGEVFELFIDDEADEPY